MLEGNDPRTKWILDLFLHMYAYKSLFVILNEGGKKHKNNSEQFR